MSSQSHYIGDERLGDVLWEALNAVPRLVKAYERDVQARVDTARVLNKTIYKYGGILDSLAPVVEMAVDAMKEKLDEGV